MSSIALVLTCSLAVAGATLVVQSPSPRTAAGVEQLGPGLFRIGTIRVDTGRHEVTVTGQANDAQILEFVANTRGGFKAYESALTLDTDGVSLNAALLLIGLDPAHARVPTRHFDPIPPKGDPLEIWVAWNPLAGPKRVRIEELLFDKRTNRTVPEGPWVYTGSTIVGPGQYLADMDGVLIGFVHSPAPVIENPRIGAVDAYGDIIRNPSLDMPGGMNVTVTIRALTAADHPRPAALPNNQPLIPEEDR